MYCTRCKIANTGDSKFCKNCGNGLTGEMKVGEPDGGSAVPSPPKGLERLLGTTIDGRYRLDALIGKGGMGAVFRTTRLSIGDDVAVKILHDSFTVDEAASIRFQREAQTSAKLKHPNVASVYDFGSADGGAKYLVMELVDGVSLRTVIDQQGALPLQTVAEITSQVCAALDEAHRHGIVHRDVKPENIIVNFNLKTLRVKVLDFGIAKLRDDSASSLTQTGSVMGTPFYMSPEQCLGEELDNRADIYSTGIVVYEMLTGTLPFNATVSTAVAVQHVSMPPRPLRVVDPNIPEGVERAVLHALEKKKEDRPNSAEGFANELSMAIFGSLSWNQGMAGGQAVNTSGQSFIAPELVDPSSSGNYSAEIPTQVSYRVERLPTMQMSASALGIANLASGQGSTSTRTTNRSAKKRALVAAAVAVIALLAIGGGTYAYLTSEPSGGKTESKDTDEIPEGMVYVPGGKLLLGSDGQEDVFASPAYEVTVDPFYLDRHEVTCEQYKKFIDAIGHPAPAIWSGSEYPVGSAKKPVTGVDYDDALAYAKWVGKRLPSEEEWEIAARGTDGRTYPWGNDWAVGMANANNVNAGVVDVGLYKGESPFGAFDMVGNGWEWTSSDFAPYPGGRLPTKLKPGDKVIRGGSWESDLQWANAFARTYWGPRGEKRYDGMTIRCVLKKSREENARKEN